MIRTLLSGAAFAASAGAHAAPLPCQPHSLLDPTAIRERVILVGDLHGTNEMPAFVSGLACSLLQQGRQVVLSLEVAGDLQPEIARYLASDDSQAARQPLSASRFGKLQDGRGSAAMMELIEQVRQLRKAGASVSAVATDMSSGQAGTRDAIMAGNIAALALGNPNATVVSLSGNMHASKRKGGHAGADYEPLGYLLTRQMPTHAIYLAHTGGTAWVCMPQCGMHEISGLGATTGARPHGYDRVVKIGGMTASPPAGEGKSALGRQGGAQ